MNRLHRFLAITTLVVGLPLTLGESFAKTIPSAMSLARNPITRILGDIRHSVDDLFHTSLEQKADLVFDLNRGFSVNPSNVNALANNPDGVFQSATVTAESVIGDQYAEGHIEQISAVSVSGGTIVDPSETTINLGTIDIKPGQHAELIVTGSIDGTVAHGVGNFLEKAGFNIADNFTFPKDMNCSLVVEQRTNITGGLPSIIPDAGIYPLAPVVEDITFSNSDVTISIDQEQFTLDKTGETTYKTNIVMNSEIVGESESSLSPEGFSAMAFEICDIANETAAEAFDFDIKEG